MKKKLNCILLIDDNYEDNFYHKIIIGEMDITYKVETAKDGVEAIAYLSDDERETPELIFLDINMPRMNGWEFLTAYRDLKPGQKAKAVIIMLTTSQNPADFKRAKEIEEVTGFEVKPLSEEILSEIMNRHFS